MRVTAQSGTSLNTAFPERRRIYQKADETPSASKNLIVRPVTAVSSPEAAMPARPLAAFLAQLIAKAQDLPATRVRRRADPVDAARVYRAVAGLARSKESKKLRLV
jgi:hypothetical protein